MHVQYKLLFCTQMEIEVQQDGVNILILLDSFRPNMAALVVACGTCPESSKILRRYQIEGIHPLLGLSFHKSCELHMTLIHLLSNVNKRGYNISDRQVNMLPFHLPWRASCDEKMATLLDRTNNVPYGQAWQNCSDWSGDGRTNI